MINDNYDERLKLFLVDFPLFPMSKTNNIFTNVNLVERWIIICLVKSVQNMKNNIYSIISRISRDEMKQYNFQVKKLLSKYYSFIKIEILSFLLLFINFYFDKIFINIKPIRIFFFNYYIKKKTDVLQIKIEKYLRFFKEDIINIPSFPLSNKEKRRYNYIKKIYNNIESKIQIYKIKDKMYFECFYKGTATKINSYDLRRYIFHFIF